MLTPLDDTRPLSPSLGIDICLKEILLFQLPRMFKCKKQEVAFCIIFTMRQSAVQW